VAEVIAVDEAAGEHGNVVESSPTNALSEIVEA
jgi:hypothetical protein